MDDIRNPNSLWATGETLSVSPSIACSYEPQSDITAFELATLIPYLFGKQMNPENWAELGAAARHLKRL